MQEVVEGHQRQMEEQQREQKALKDKLRKAKNAIQKEKQVGGGGGGRGEVQAGDGRWTAGDPRRPLWSYGGPGPGPGGEPRPWVTDAGEFFFYNSIKK